MRTHSFSVLIPFLLFLFLLLWVSPVCGGGNLSIFESEPQQKEQTDLPDVAPVPEKTLPSPGVDQSNQPGQKNTAPADDDEDEEEDDWDEDSVYDNDKSC